MEMERINDFFICAICKRHFYTKIGFQIHTKKEHQQQQDSLEHISVSSEENKIDAENDSFSKNGTKPNKETEKDLESYKTKEPEDKIKLSRVFPIKQILTIIQDRCMKKLNLFNVKCAK